MRTILTLTTAAAVLAVMAAASAKDQGNNTFISKAIQGNYAEVKMGQLAQKNGLSDGVKSFGEMLVTDHSAANQSAVKTAKDMGVAPPNQPNKEQQANYDKMSQMTGSSFDKAFIRDMVADHKKDISEYQQASKKSGPAGEYAKESLPTLQKHLRTAESLQSKK